MSGRRGAVADEARARAVRPRNRSWEADEEGGGNLCCRCCGAGGAKGGGQGERERAKHAPDTAPGARVTGARSRTEGFASPSLPKVGAVCINWARTDLRGGRRVTCVPTAICPGGPVRMP